MSFDEKTKLQDARLKQHFISALGAPYWVQKFKEYDVDPYATDIFSELKKLPILSKNEVQKNAHIILNDNLPKRTLLKRHTSGTTGAGLIFWETLDANAERWAIWWRYRQLHGLNLDTYCGYFGGRSVVPITQTKPPYWRNNLFGKQVLFSGYHLSSNTLSNYVSAIKKYKIDWLHGYPSTLALLASLIKKSDRNFALDIKKISIGGESLLVHQKDIIIEIFGCPVIQHYGLQESVANISECPHGHMHVDEDLSYLEFLTINEGDTKIIAGTNWTNPAFPLFRYNTNDRVSIPNNEVCCDWTGRQVLSIDGRQEDYVELPNGSKIGRLDHIFKDMTNIREAQLKQLKDKSLIITIVPSENFTDKTKNKLLFEAEKRLGKEIPISIHITDKISRTKAGKLRFVLSEIQENKII